MIFRSVQSGGAVPSVRCAFTASGWKVLVLLCFSAWVLWVGAAHEPWADEAQAWLVARDNALIPMLAERVRYEGSPGLWHLILWCAIRLNLPYAGLFLISAGFAIAGAAVVLWRAPFPAWMRIATLTSYFFGYQFSCVARSYSADLLFIPLAAAFFPTRGERPWRYGVVIALLANLNAFSFLSAAVLGLEWLCILWPKLKVRNRTAIFALSLALSGGLFALATAWPTADNMFMRTTHLNPLMLFLRLLRSAFIDRTYDFYTLSGMPEASEMLWGSLISIVILMLSVKAMDRRRHVYLGLGMLAVIIVFGTAEYSMPWHGGLLYLSWIFALWLTYSQLGKRARYLVWGLFALVAVIQTIETAETGLWDRTHKYAVGAEGAHLVRAYKRAHPDARLDIAGYHPIVIQPWLSGNLFSNMSHGQPHPAGVLWTPDSYISAAPIAWPRAVAEKPDAILIGSLVYNDKGVVNPKGTDFREVACRAGYRITHRLPASMLWRGYISEDTGLMLLERGRCRPTVISK